MHLQVESGSNNRPLKQNKLYNHNTLLTQQLMYSR